MDAKIGRSATILLALGALGCGEAPVAERFAVRDSAGVTIVESVAPTWTEGTTWRLRIATVVGLLGRYASLVSSKATQ